MEALSIEKRRGGRLSRLDAAAMQDRILDAATELFLEHGFGATSIDALAVKLRISKRTFYHRFRGKADLFEAVIGRMIEQWRVGFDAAAMPRGTPAERLRRAARGILDVAVSPQALALYRLVVAEAARFPELARIMHSHGTGAGVARILPLLENGDGSTESDAAQRFAAEQFLALVITVPRRRALGLGAPMSRAERDIWIRKTVDLFLHGAHGRSSND